MTTYIARIRFVDEREITVEAETDEEAKRKYESGEWDGEHTVDFFSEGETLSLRKEAPRRGRNNGEES